MSFPKSDFSDKLRLLILALAALQGNPQSLKGQDSVTICGKVVEEKSEAPIQGLSIKVLKEEFSNYFETSTDSSGRYTLKVPKENAYIIQINQAGYKEQTVFHRNVRKFREVFELRNSNRAVIYYQVNDLYDVGDLTDDVIFRSPQIQSIVK